ncbi:MAG: polyprenyl diphosphate synthase [Pseudomonadota bacterium]
MQVLTNCKAQCAKPLHLAMIMDGNRRWARAQHLCDHKGYEVGIDAMEEVIMGCMANQITDLTLFAFSTENWSRTKDGIVQLFTLMVHYMQSLLEDETQRAQRFKHVQASFIGDQEALQERLCEMGEAELAARVGDLSHKVAMRDIAHVKLHLRFAVNYGGKSEIVRAVNDLLANGRDITEESLGNKLQEDSCPAVDFLIRTGGEMRISNFLLWQLAYSEILFIDKKWPELTRSDIGKFMDIFQKRVRRFGRD